MKSLTIGLFSLLALQLNAQQMRGPQQTVIGLFVATDQRDWQAVEQSFNTEVVLDYSSMNGAPAATLSPEQITTAWKGILPGFEHTHHQLGNMSVSENGDKAQVFCYGTASHYLQDEAGNIWWVVGTYNFDLIKEKDGTWKITSMKFNYKYQDGNTTLPAKAMKIASTH